MTLTLAQILIVLVVIGIVGSAVEKAGLALEMPRVIAVGKVLESLAADLPKTISNVYGTFKGETKP